MKKILSVVAVIAIGFGSVWLYEYRVQQLTLTYGGTPMPDLTETKAARETRLRAAQLAAQVRTNELWLAQLKRDQSEVDSLIAFNFKLQAALGITDPVYNTNHLAMQIRIRSEIASAERQLRAAQQAIP